MSSTSDSSSDSEGVSSDENRPRVKPMESDDSSQPASTTEEHMKDVMDTNIPDGEAAKTELTPLLEIASKHKCGKSKNFVPKPTEDVAVSLYPRKPESLLLFSSTVLAKKSGWFKKGFAKWDGEVYGQVGLPWMSASCVRHFMVCSIDGLGWEYSESRLDDVDLQPQSNCDPDFSNEPHPSGPSDQRNGAVAVKQEPKQDRAPTSPDIPQQSTVEEEYVTLFTSLCGRAKELDKCSLLPDGGSHVASSDSLVRHSKVYEAVPASREASHRLFYPRMPALFDAIAQDPPSWLAMACTLEDSIIFKEAVIHISGCLPQWPWPTTRAYIKLEIEHEEAVSAMMNQKANALTLERYEVDHILFQNTLSNRGVPIQLDKKIAWRFQVVSLWRDWFCQQLAETTSPITNHIYDRTKIASIYRAIQDGGDAYLETESVLARLRDVSGANKDKEGQCRNDLKSLEGVCEHGGGEIDGYDVAVEEGGPAWLPYGCGGDGGGLSVGGSG